MTDNALTEDQIKYYKKMCVVDPNKRLFQGGARNVTFPNEFDKLIQETLEVIWKEDKLKTCDHYAKEIERALKEEKAELAHPFNLKEIKAEYIRCIFTNWNFSIKNAVAVDIRKFVDENVIYYNKFIPLLKIMYQQNLNHLLYLDESSFDVRHFKKTRGWSSKGEKITFKDLLGIKHESYSVSLMISVRNDGSNHIFYVIRKDSNDGLFISYFKVKKKDIFKYIIFNKNKAINYIEFLLTAIEKTFLRQGDNLVADNARIHRSYIVEQVVGELFKTMDIARLFLPTYSPELNPCELVFAQVKKWIRTHTDRYNLSFNELIEEAFSVVKKDNCSNYYDHCILRAVPLDFFDFFYHFNSSKTLQVGKNIFLHSKYSNFLLQIFFKKNISKSLKIFLIIFFLTQYSNFSFLFCLMAGPLSL
jgi:transposase